LSKEARPKGPGFGLLQRERLKAQGKNNKKELILSSCQMKQLAKRRAQKNTVNAKAPYICTLCAMLYALLARPKDQVLYFE